MGDHWGWQINMEPSSEDNLSPRQGSPKIPLLLDASMTEASTTINVKKEETDDETFDAAVAIFDDVDDESTDDGSELVDVDHVGFIEHNGVNCWVCPGPYFQIFPYHGYY